MDRGKRGRYFWHGIQKLPERWGKCITSDGVYFQ